MKGTEGTEDTEDGHATDSEMTSAVLRRIDMILNSDERVYFTFSVFFSQAIISAL